MGWGWLVCRRIILRKVGVGVELEFFVEIMKTLIGLGTNVS